MKNKKIKSFVGLWVNNSEFYFTDCENFDKAPDILAS